ncbi:small ribosomal subunit protein mS39-like isoform X2 [Dysidea avara]|uniref:small ribosomal subunit protein mS39-like isoform X2 n=1 Tax=Dysidea avara TaxID=196820 RepID=UPI00332E47CB
MFPACSRGIKQCVLVRALTLVLRQATTISGVSVATSEDNEDDNALEKPLPPPPMIPKLKPNAVLKALASTVTDLDHPFYMGKCLPDPTTPVSINERMKYVWAREAGVNAAKYVIEKWSDLFPSQDCNPDLRPHRSLHYKVSHDEVWLQTLISKRRVEEALIKFDKLEKQGEKISLETRNNLLELLAYTGLGNNKIVDRRSKFVEHQALLCDPDTKPQFIPANVTRTKESTLQDKIDEINILLLSDKYGEFGREGDSPWTLKYPRKVWSLDNKAEKLFESMHDKDGATYDALILGLFKYKSYDRMFKLYSTMRNAGYQASTSTYNYLLMALDSSQSPVAWETAMELAKNMTQTPSVHPDITTFNMLLRLCKLTGKASRENAEAIFQEMLFVDIEPNLTTFLRILQAYIYENMGASVVLKIVSYLEQHPHVLQLSGYFDLFFFEAALNAASSIGADEAIVKLLKMAGKDSWFLFRDVDDFLSSHLIKLSHKGDIKYLMDTYRWLLSKQYRPDDNTYAALFKVCSSPEIVLELWNDYKKFDVLMSSGEVVKHIHELFKRGYNVNEVQKYLTVAEESWSTLREKNITPRPSVIIGMVLMCLQANQRDKAWYYYRKFEAFKYYPSADAAEGILDAYADATDKSNAYKVMQIIRSMVAAGHPKPTNYNELCSNFGLPLNTWAKLKVALEGGKGKVFIDKEDLTIQKSQREDRKPRRRQCHEYGASIAMEGGLYQQLTEHELVNFFREYGLKREDVIFKALGYAVVVFPTPQLAQRAVEEKHMKYIGKNFMNLSLKHFSYGVTVLAKKVSPSLTAERLARFFEGYNVTERDIMFETKQDGKVQVRNALIAFGTPELAKQAVREGRDKHLDDRYLNLSIKNDSKNYTYPNTEDTEKIDTNQDTTPNHHQDTTPNHHQDTTPNHHQDTTPNHHQDTTPNHHRDTRPNQDTIMLHGLIPYSTTEDEIADYFQDYHVCSEDVKLLVDSSGKLTGVIQVTFPSTDVARKAVKEKDGRHFIGRPLHLTPHNL